ncbi:MAG TPA: hypothetical protein VGR10_05105 [Thermoleophilaceae bacterium]|nr:hypothetical protein [Thermoleophilaceae bacterium]
MEKRRAASGLLACGAIALAGCGGGDEEEQPEPSVQAFCDTFQQIMEEPPPTPAPGDPQATADAFRQLEDQAGQLVPVAPEDIRPTVEQVQQGAAGLAEELGQVDPEAPQEEAQAQAEGLQQQFAELQMPLQELGQYTSENCEEIAPPGGAPEGQVPGGVPPQGPPPEGEVPGGGGSGGGGGGAQGGGGSGGGQGSGGGG